MDYKPINTETMKTTVKSAKSNRVYNVTSELYGTSNTVYTLWYGGISVANTGNRNTHGIEEAIEQADLFCDKLQISVVEI